jgi:hypothetical protein
MLTAIHNLKSVIAESAHFLMTTERARYTYSASQPFFSHVSCLSFAMLVSLTF